MKCKKILIVSEAGDALPSGIVRVQIFRDLYIQNGYEVRYINRLSPFLVRIATGQGGFLSLILLMIKRRFSSNIKNGEYLERNKSNKRQSLAFKTYTYFRDKIITSLARRYDVVYMSKVRSLRLIRQIKRHTSARVVLDFGDAIWLSGRPSNAYFDIDEFNQSLREVDAVTTDNEYTASYARKFNKNVTAIPDQPQIEFFDKYRDQYSKGTSSQIVIGWIGSPSTLYNLYAVWAPLEEIFKKHTNIHLRLVGTGVDTNMMPQFENVRYSYRAQYGQKEMIEEVLKMDIGLFPLQNTEASKVRGVLKAAVYMSGEVAIIASRVGQCVDFIQDGFNGMLAENDEEWFSKLDLLIRDAALRRVLAKNGLATVRANFSLERSFNMLTSVFNDERNNN